MRKQNQAKVMPYPAGVAKNPPDRVELQMRDLLAIKMLGEREAALTADREQLFREIEAAYGIEAGGIGFYQLDGKVLIRRTPAEPPNGE